MALQILLTLTIVGALFGGGEAQTVYQPFDGRNPSILANGAAVNQMLGLVYNTNAVESTTGCSGLGGSLFGFASGTSCIVVLTAAPTYNAAGVNGYSEMGGVTMATEVTVRAYVTPAAMPVNAASTTAEGTTVTTLTAINSFYKDCNNAAAEEYFTVSGTNVQWAISPATGGLYLLGSLRCVFSQLTTADTITSNSNQVLVDITFTDSVVGSCILNPTLDSTMVTTPPIVGSVSYPGATTCTATSTPAGLFSLSNGCNGVVTLASALNYNANNLVTLTVSDGSTPVTCTMTVLDGASAPVCGNSIAGQVDLTYWRTLTGTSAVAVTVIADKAIATDTDNDALTMTIDSTTVGSGDYTIVNGDLQIAAASVASKTDGSYTVLVRVVDTTPTTVTCTYALTVGPGMCI